MKRCEAVSPDGDRCGDYEGHDGKHTKIVASEFLRLTLARVRPPLQENDNG